MLFLYVPIYAQIEMQSWRTLPELEAWLKQEDYSSFSFKGPFCTDWSWRLRGALAVWDPLEKGWTWTSIFDVAPLLQSESPQDWDVESIRIWFKLQAMQLRDRVFYSPLLTCSIYISDNCMFYLKIFLLRAGLNSVDINCWVGTLRPGPNLQFLNKCGHSSHTVDYIYLYIRLRACYTCTY